MNIYVKDDRLRMLENNEIDDVECGFMEGYEAV